MIGLVRFFKLFLHGGGWRFVEQTGDDDGTGAEKEAGNDFVQAEVIQTGFPQDDGGRTDKDAGKGTVSGAAQWYLYDHDVLSWKEKQAVISGDVTVFLKKY